MADKIFIIGAGGHAKVAIAAAQAAGFEIAGVFDDDPAKNGAVLLGHSVTAPFPPDAWWREQEHGAHIAIGNNAARQRIASRLACRWISIIHPSACIDGSVELSPGVLICPRVVIHPDSTLGAHTILNTGAVVEHDCRVGAFVHLAPLSCLAGSVHVGDGVFVGVGASVIPGVTVGEWARLGAGAAVIADIPARTTAVGVPARGLPGR